MSGGYVDLPGGRRVGNAPGWEGPYWDEVRPDDFPGYRDPADRAYPDRGEWFPWPAARAAATLCYLYGGAEPRHTPDVPSSSTTRPGGIS